MLNASDIKALRQFFGDMPLGLNIVGIVFLANQVAKTALFD
jgi:hypothetical protein